MTDNDMLIAVTTAIHLVDCEADPCEWEFYPRSEEAQYAAAAIKAMDGYDVKRLALHPGDTVVLELEDRHVTAEQADHIREMLRQRFPDNEVLIVAGGQLKVIGPDEAAA